VPRRRVTRRAVRDAVSGYLYILPWLLGFVLFTFGPMVASLILSFFEYNAVSTPRWVGIANYVTAFGGEDRLFWMSWERTWSYAILSIPTGVALSLVLATLLNQKLKGTTIFRTLFFLPSLIPVVASALLWQWLLQPEVGLVNYLLWEVRIPGPRWLADPGLALPALVIIALWGSVGGSRMIIFLAGLQGVPEEFYDAAAIDGAGPWAKFVNVTLPMLSPTVFFVLVLGVIGAIRVFSISFVATNGGPAYATWFYMLQLFNSGFRSFQMGYACALAWILFAVVLVLTLVQIKFSGRWVYYAGGEGEGAK
jgi:multiple sugar transport system permease protein